MAHAKTRKQAPTKLHKWSPPVMNIRLASSTWLEIMSPMVDELKVPDDSTASLQSSLRHTQSLRLEKCRMNSGKKGKHRQGNQREGKVGRVTNWQCFFEETHPPPKQKRNSHQCGDMFRVDLADTSVPVENTKKTLRIGIQEILTLGVIHTLLY